MRTVPDRIRHAVSFEIIGLLLITPLGAWIFKLPLFEIGVVGAGSALIATLWNYVYNLGFDHALRRVTGSTARTVTIRILHAVLFEAGLLAMLMPFIALYLGIGLWEALMMDIAFAGFYVVYAFAFNWVYDLAFPVPSGARRVEA